MTVRYLLTVLMLLVLVSPGQAQEQDASNRYYEVEAVNAGLGEPPDGLNLETPQAMMETFIFAAEREDWRTAAWALDLGQLDEPEQARRGPEFARQLHEVIERGMWLDWTELPDRPDALEANVSAKDPMAGEPRRNIRIAIVDLDDRPVSIRIARMKPADGEPVWLFSRQTVGNVPAMHAIYGPTEFERSLPGFLQERAFWTLTWWEVVALPLVLLGAVVAASLAYGAVGRARRRQPSRIAGNILDAVRVPVALMVFVGTFALAKSLFFTFSGVVNTFLTPLETILFVIALALIAVRIVDAILDRVARRNVVDLEGTEAADERDLYTNISAARRAAVVLAFLLGAALILIQMNAFQTLGFSLLASAGVIGLILAFAARTVLADIMASLQIALAKTARIGDAVLYKGQWCYVEKINFTYLQLQSWDNRRLMVPVNEFVSNTFENWSKQDSRLLQTVELRFDHRADIDRLREALRDFAQRDDEVIEKEDAKIQVIGQNAEGMLVRFYAWAADPASGWNMHCRLREEMLKAAARLEAEVSDEPADRPAYFPRERETKLADFSGKG